MSMDRPVVIRVEGLGKRYRLGTMGGATLGEDLQAWMARMLGRPDPRLPLGAEGVTRSDGDDFQALHDVSFDLRQGEILGIIGRNGAGKSTLLKLLSRITLPSEGRIRMRGRVSSLLEVGTGFNPELTGRENIYLNGAILGMKKAEIDRKLDAIIAFSGIPHHIDTPVKRYSSGMKVRLGFAVAAHLEPEILIIDEVLAVGDAEFQRKCLGKMKDVAQSGRTILFVSHNMTAIRSLCSRVIWLDGGGVRRDGAPEDVVMEYLATTAPHNTEVEWPEGEGPGTAELRLRRVAVGHEADGALTWNDPFHIDIDLRNTGFPDGDLNVGIHVHNDEDILVFGSTWRESIGRAEPLPIGSHHLRCDIPRELLNTGDYRVTVNVFRLGNLLFREEDCVAFAIHEAERQGAWFGRRKGIFRPRLSWSSRSVTAP